MPSQKEDEASVSFRDAQADVLLRYLSAGEVFAGAQMRGLI